MIMHTVRCGENVLGRDQGATTEGGVESGIYKGNLIKQKHYHYLIIVVHLTCQGYSLTSVSTPFTILDCLFASPQVHGVGGWVGVGVVDGEF